MVDMEVSQVILVPHNFDGIWTWKMKKRCRKGENWGCLYFRKHPLMCSLFEWSDFQITLRWCWVIILNKNLVWPCSFWSELSILFPRICPFVFRLWIPLPAFIIPYHADLSKLISGIKPWIWCIYIYIML